MNEALVVVAAAATRRQKNVAIACIHNRHSKARADASALQCVQALVRVHRNDATAHNKCSTENVMQRRRLLLMCRDEARRGVMLRVQMTKLAEFDARSDCVAIRPGANVICEAVGERRRQSAQRSELVFVVASLAQQQQLEQRPAVRVMASEQPGAAIDARDAKAVIRVPDAL